MIASLLFLSLAPAAVPPMPLRGIISAEDYPTSALNEGAEGATLAEMVVGPDGRVDTCRILVSSHHSALDAATCRIIKARAIFEPARDSEGKPIYGVYRQVITWSINSPKTAERDPELELTVNRAPNGVELPTEFTISYLSAKNGTISNCRADDRSAAVPPPLVAIACQVLSQSPGEIVRNGRREPVDAMNSSLVRFSLKQ